MMRRSVRVLVLLLTVGVTAGVVWRATTNEQARGRMRLASQQTDAIAADAIFELSDLRATLHAYVAPGQGVEFWSSRAKTQMGNIRARVGELEPAASAANHPLNTAHANLNTLAAIERRILAAVREVQPLVAGDMIFTEARDLIDGAARDLSDARQAMARAASAREAGTANEQSLLAGGLIASWIFALILLTPVPAVASAASISAPSAASAAPATAAAPSSAPSALSAASASEPSAAPLSAPSATLVSASSAATAADPSAPSASSADAADRAALQRLSDLCADIARVADARELSPLLSRTAALVRARGLVVWLVSEDGRHLLPAMAHGYDQKLLSRLGAVPVEDHNLTASAFRMQEPTRADADADAHTPGAVAVPMLSAGGASGVLAAEVEDGADLDRAAALVGVVAAQLAGLFPGAEPQLSEPTVTQAAQNEPSSRGPQPR